MTKVNIEKFRHPALLLAILTALSAYFYTDSITLFPSYAHAWTQSDRFALALGFLDNNFNLFKPQTYNLASIDGVTGVDLPIHEYVIALMMKVTGSESPGLFRMYVLGYSFLGYLFLFQLARERTGSLIKSYALVILVFACPIITYYQAGFIPSATNLSTAFMAYYFYFKYAGSQRLRHFYLAVLLMTLAALSRLPFSIFLVAMSAQFLVQQVRTRSRPWKPLVALGLGFAALAAWGAYKHYLNSTYGSQFLTTLLPPESWNEFRQIATVCWNKWRLEMFSVWHGVLFLVMIAATAYAILRRSRELDVSRPLFLQGAWALGGAAIYFVALAQQYVVHDYYLIDSFYPGLILLMLGGMVLIPMKTVRQHAFWGIVMVGLLVGSVLHAKDNHNTRYADTLHDRFETTRKNFVGADLFLDGLGIPRSAKVLVIDAYSTNVALILMDRKGYTVLSTSPENIRNALDYDYDYLVTQDIFFPSDVVRNYPKLLDRVERMGGNGRITVFQPRQQTLPGSLHHALGMPDSVQTVIMHFDDTTLASGWTNVDDRTAACARSAPYSIEMHPDAPFGPTFETSLRAGQNRLLFEAHIYANADYGRFVMAASIADSGGDVYYWEFPVNLAHLPKDTWVHYPGLFILPDGLSDQAVLKCYIWNKEGAEAYMDDLRLTLFGQH